MRLEPRAETPWSIWVAAPLAAVAVSLILAALLVLWSGAEPFSVFGLVIKGAVGSQFALFETLTRATPLIFTGLRLSLGVGWMVLIAAEMLAQNPGLGKFVWDEFQNGSSQSLARIMVAVLTIGIIGFVLDRLMSLVESVPPCARKISR